MQISQNKLLNLFMRNKLPILLLVIISSAFVTGVFHTKSSAKNPEIKVVEQESASKRSSCGFDTSHGYADLVESVLPSVVNISTTSVQERVIPSIHDLFGFGMFGFEGMNHGGKKIKQKSHSLGSGFLIDASGHIATNYHVIKNAVEIKVTTHEMKDYKAKVIGFDEKSDLAVIKIEMDTTKEAVKFGSSDAARIGDIVLAIGNPFGLGGSVTTGIVSAKSRSIDKRPYDDLIQTDASINQGNSGGPMFNTCGEVIGINTAIISPSGGNVGIGFAISSDMAVNILNKIKNKEKISHPYLGVEVQKITPEIASALGLKDSNGAYVNAIVPKSPAEKGGLQNGDVIIAINGKKINEIRELSGFVMRSKVGDVIKLTLIRDGKEIIINVTLQEAANLSHEDTESDESPKGTKTTFGLSLRKLDEETKRQMRIPSNVNGVLIVGVYNESISKFGEIQEGDILTAINGKAVSSIADVKQASQKIKADGKKFVVFKIYRNGTNISLGVQFE